ncbi:MAG: hypothetical protein NZ959_05300 [Armatimonadetes bacterium]|nr:hypothetical protein [Armatimonadota bacterium]MDW8122248.1 hypothetical protein [Armatimonadota bacterium]
MKATRLLIPLIILSGTAGGQGLTWVSRGLYGGLAESRFPSVSADGSRIAFQVERPGQPPEIWMAILVAGQYVAQPVTVGSPPTPAIGRHPSLSHDGRTLVYQPVTGQQIGVWSDQATGPILQPFVPIYPGLAPPFVQPTISGDGQHIVFVGRVGFTWQVLAYDRSRGVTTLISFVSRLAGDGTVARGPAAFHCVSPTVSADGRMVAYMTRDRGVLDENGDGQSDATSLQVPWLITVHDRDADGNGVFDEAVPGATRTVGIFLPQGSVAFAPSLSPDGAYLAFAVATPTPPARHFQEVVDLWVLRLQDGVSLRITQMLLPQGSLQLGGSGMGYSDWMGAPTLVVSPQDPSVVFLAFHSWEAGLLHPSLQRPAVRGVGNVYLARCDFRQNAVSLFPVLQQPLSVDFASVDDDRDGRIDEDPINNADDDGDGRVDEDPSESIPQGHSLFPVVSLVQPAGAGNLFSVVFHSLAPLARAASGGPFADTNGRWDIYLSQMILP